MVETTPSIYEFLCADRGQSAVSAEHVASGTDLRHLEGFKTWNFREKNPEASFERKSRPWLDKLKSDCLNQDLIDLLAMSLDHQRNGNALRTDSDPDITGPVPQDKRREFPPISSRCHVLPVLVTTSLGIYRGFQLLSSSGPPMNTRYAWG